MSADSTTINITGSSNNTDLIFDSNGSIIGDNVDLSDTQFIAKVLTLEQSLELNSANDLLIAAGVSNNASGVVTNLNRLDVHESLVLKNIDDIATLTGPLPIMEITENLATLELGLVHHNKLLVFTGQTYTKVTAPNVIAGFNVKLLSTNGVLLVNDVSSAGLGITANSKFMNDGTTLASFEILKNTQVTLTQTTTDGMYNVVGTLYPIVEHDTYLINHPKSNGFNQVLEKNNFAKINENNLIIGGSDVIAHLNLKNKSMKTFSSINNYTSYYKWIASGPGTLYAGNEGTLVGDFTKAGEAGVYLGNGLYNDVNATYYQGTQDWGDFPTEYTARNQMPMLVSGGATGNSYDIFLSRIIRGQRYTYLNKYELIMHFNHSKDANGVVVNDPNTFTYLAYTSGSLLSCPFAMYLRKREKNANGEFEYCRLASWCYDFDENERWNFAAVDHLASGGENDPHTDWIYPRFASDAPPVFAPYSQLKIDGTRLCESQYNLWVADSIAAGGGSKDANGSYISSGGADYKAAEGPEICGRLSLMAWNAGLDGLPENSDSLLPGPGSVLLISITETKFPINGIAYGDNLLIAIRDKILEVYNYSEKVNSFSHIVTIDNMYSTSLTSQTNTIFYDSKIFDLKIIDKKLVMFNGTLNRASGGWLTFDLSGINKNSTVNNLNGQLISDISNRPISLGQNISLNINEGFVVAYFDANNWVIDVNNTLTNSDYKSSFKPLEFSQISEKDKFLYFSNGRVNLQVSKNEKDIFFMAIPNVAKSKSPHYDESKVLPFLWIYDNENPTKDPQILFSTLLFALESVKLVLLDINLFALVYGDNKITYYTRNSNGVFALVSSENLVGSLPNNYIQIDSDRQITLSLNDSREIVADLRDINLPRSVLGNDVTNSVASPVVSVITNGLTWPTDSNVVALDISSVPNASKITSGYFVSQKTNTGFASTNNTLLGSAMIDIDDAYGYYKYGLQKPNKTSTAQYAEGFIFNCETNDNEVAFVGENGENKLIRRTIGQMYSDCLLPGGLVFDTTTNEPIGYTDDKYKGSFRIRASVWPDKTISLNELLTDTALNLNKDLENVTQADLNNNVAQYKYNWENWPTLMGAPFYNVSTNTEVTDNTPFNSSIHRPGYPHTEQMTWCIANDLPEGIFTNDLSNIFLKAELLAGSPSIGLLKQTIEWTLNSSGLSSVDLSNNLENLKIDILKKNVIFIKAVYKFVGLSETMWNRYHQFYDSSFASGTYNGIIREEEFDYTKYVKPTNYVKTPYNDLKLTNIYISNWCDTDLGLYTNDMVGVDVSRNTGYVYNGTKD